MKLNYELLYSDPDLVALVRSYNEKEDSVTFSAIQDRLKELGISLNKIALSLYLKTFKGMVK